MSRHLWGVSMVCRHRGLDPDRLFSAHLPASSGRVEQFLKVVASAPDADPFVPPNAAAFAGIAAEILSSRT